VAATREDWQKRLGPLYGGAVALVHSTPWRWPLELGDDARSPLWIVLLGIPVGLAAWVVAAIAHGAGLPPSLSAVLGLAALCMASAGLVERGLAECVDRWVRASSSTSASGTYASSAAAPGMISIPAALVLAFSVVVRAVAVLSVSPEHWMWLFIATAVLGRWAAVFLQALGDPIQHDTHSRSFVGVPAPAWLVAAISGGALALAVLALGKIGVVAMALAAICVFGLGIFTQRKDGGLAPAVVAAAAAIGELFVLLVATMH
jgi:cobalamin synthase